MSKLAFFLKFYRTQKIRFLILIFIFTFAGAILSCSLLVQSNNDDYANVQMKDDFFFGQCSYCCLGMHQYSFLSEYFHAEKLCHA